MKRFAIERKNEATITREDVDAGAMQTVLTLAQSQREPGIEPNPFSERVAWVRSYWHEGTTWGLCLYTGPDLVDIAEYHRVCEVPFVEFREVDELTDDLATVNDLGLTELLEGESLFTIEAPLGADATADAAAFARLPRTLTEAAGGLEGSFDHVRWIRAYWDAERRGVLSLYATREAATIDALTRLLDGSGVTVRPVTEISPGEYLG